MATGINIYAGAEGQGKGGAMGLAEGGIIDKDLAGKLSGIDQAALATILGGVGAGAAIGAGKLRKLWQKGRIPKGASVADDAVKAGAKGVANVADDAVKAGAKGLASTADDVALAGAKTGLLRGAGNVISKVAVPVAVAAEVGLRGYDSYKIEKQHDSVEDAHAKGLVDAKTMDMVTEERNAGHARNVAGGVGGLAGAWAGFKVGGAIGVAGGALTGPGAVVFSPLLGVVGAVSGAVAGYYAGSKLAEGASDMITGHDSSYKHTQQALSAIQVGSMANSQGATGATWAAAREKSGYQQVTSTPGLSSNPQVQQQFSQGFSTSYNTPSVDVPEATPVIPLARGGAVPSHARTRTRQGVRVGY